MVALNCNVETCVHNADRHCCKGDICVEGYTAKEPTETCCGSFAERKGESFRNRFEKPDRFIGVACEAEQCVFNENRRCIAEHITIAGDQASQAGDTRCASFRV